MAYGSGLLNRRGLKTLARVRLPPPPHKKSLPASHHLLLYPVGAHHTLYSHTPSVYNTYMSDISPVLKAHLEKEHTISPFQTYLKEIVYGGNDGIVTTFAVVAGFSGAQIGAGLPTYSFLTVLLFGTANLFADGVSMGLGNFLSLRSEKDLYKKESAKELYEIRHNPEQEAEETIEILQNKGFSKTDAATLTEIYSKNERYWLSFMMNYELEIPNPEGENPYLTGLATFTAFIIFGSIPLIPYLFFQDLNQAFFNSVLATISALILLGILRWRITKESVVRSILEIVLIGGLSAVIAYIVGTFFAV